jgi:O-antigen/teichoic acid export membrane protein
MRSTTPYNDLPRLQLLHAPMYPALAIPGAALVRAPGLTLGRVIALIIVFIAASSTRSVVSSPVVNHVLAQRPIRIGLPVILAGIIHTLFGTADWWALTDRVRTDAPGHYLVVIMALPAVAHLPIQISLPCYPRMAHTLPASRDAKNMRDLVNRPLLYTVAAYIPAVRFLIFATPQIPRTFPPKRTPGIPIVVVSTVIPILSVSNEAYGGVPNLLNRRSWYNVAVLIAALANLGISLLFVGRYQQVGMAIRTFAAFGVLIQPRILLGGPSLRRTVSWNT